MKLCYDGKNTVSIEITLIKNKFFDVVKNRHDSENWIPFTFCLTYGDKEYLYDENSTATFTVMELNNFISGMESICQKAIQNERDYLYEFYCLEAYFGIVFYDVMELDIIGVDCWINIATMTNGKQYGHDEGVRFDVKINTLKMFCDDLKTQLDNLLSNDVS